MGGGVPVVRRGGPRARPCGAAIDRAPIFALRADRAIIRMAYGISDRRIESLQAARTGARSLTGDTHDLKHVEMSISNANSSC